MKTFLLVLLALTSTIFVSTQIQPVFATFTVTLTPPSQAVAEFSSVSWTVTITDTNGLGNTVTLTYLGSTTAFSVNPVVVPPAGSAVSTLTLTTSVCPGVYTVTVVGTDPGTGDTASGSATVTVFSIFPPLSVDVTTDKTSYTLGETVRITASTNKPAQATLRIVGPAGTVRTFSLLFTGPGSLVRTLQASEPTGTYTATFEARYCAEAASDSVTYVVSPATYEVAISTSGLPDDVSTEVKVDGAPRTTITGAQIISLTFTIDTTHTIEVSRTVEGKEGVRYICERNKFTVSSTGSLTFEYETEYQLIVVTDPDGITTPGGAGWYKSRSAATAGPVPAVIDGPPGVRYEFAGWEIDGVLQPKDRLSVTLTMDKPHKAIARYQTEVLLTVESPYGDPPKPTYYDKGTTARFAVSSPVGFLIQQVFDHWEGDYSGTNPSGEILMDGPKTVRAVWETSYFQLYIALGVLGAVVVVAVLLMRRRSAAPTLKAPPTPPPPPPPESMGMARKCPNCGAAVPDGQAFCTECGQKMPD